MRVILITKEFTEKNIKSMSGLDEFGFSVTKDGRYFCDVNSLNTHPELFLTLNPIKYIEVDESDLPKIEI